MVVRGNIGNHGPTFSGPAFVYFPCGVLGARKAHGLDLYIVDVVVGLVVYLNRSLERQEKVRQLAYEFGLPLAEMAASALDAGIAFMRARFGTPDAGPFFSPAPIADAGWDILADNPEEREFYVALCKRLCSLEGVPATVLEHERFSEADYQLAGITGAIAAAVSAMDRLGLHYVSAHWPLNAAPPCRPVDGPTIPPRCSPKAVLIA